MLIYYDSVRLEGPYWKLIDKEYNVQIKFKEGIYQYTKQIIFLFMFDDLTIPNLPTIIENAGKWLAENYPTIFEGNQHKKVKKKNYSY